MQATKFLQVLRPESKLQSSDASKIEILKGKSEHIPSLWTVFWFDLKIFNFVSLIIILKLRSVLLSCHVVQGLFCSFLYGNNITTEGGHTKYQVTLASCSRQPNVLPLQQSMQSNTAPWQHTCQACFLPQLFLLQSLCKHLKQI